jgi:hypothetical protein
VADDVVVLAGGRVLADGPTASVVAGHGDLERAFLALTEPDHATDDGTSTGSGAPSDGDPSGHNPSGHNPSCHDPGDLS